MVFVPILVWIKLRNAVEGRGFSINNSTYTDLEDYDMESDIGKDSSHPNVAKEYLDKCVWPCDAAVLSWHRFVHGGQDRVGSDIRVSMCVFTLIACVPSWIVALGLCGIFGIRILYGLVPAWAIIDAIILLTYYGMRFGSEMMYGIVHGTRIHECFYILCWSTFGQIPWLHTAYHYCCVPPLKPQQQEEH